MGEEKEGQYVIDKFVHFFYKDVLNINMYPVLREIINIKSKFSSIHNSTPIPYNRLFLKGVTP